MIKKYWIYVYIVLMFMVSILNMQLIIFLMLEYILPINLVSVDGVHMVVTKLGDAFYLGLASTFFFFVIAITPAILFVKFKINFLFAVLLTILLASLLYYGVNIYSWGLIDFAKENNYLISLYPFYTNAIIIISIITFFTLYGISYLISKKEV